MSQNDQVLSDTDFDALIDGVNEAFEKGNLNSVEPKDAVVLPIDEVAVRFLVENQAMAESDARQYVHDARHLMREMGVADTTKLDLSLTK